MESNNPLVKQTRKSVKNLMMRIYSSMRMKVHRINGVLLSTCIFYKRKVLTNKYYKDTNWKTRVVRL
jgi:hypothetical protein